jgi:hypothetical protein
MLKKISAVLFTLVAVLTMFSLAGCPGLIDPELGDLKGGPRDVTEPEIVEPEIPEIIVYGVKLGGIVAEDGIPGFTVADAASGFIHLGDNALAADATDLVLDAPKTKEPVNSIVYTVSSDGSAAIADEDWESFAEEGTVIEGLIPSGSFIILKVSRTVEDAEELSYYKYLVTWGNNGAFIESLLVGGRAATSLGTPYVGQEKAGDDGIESGTIFLTAAQIAANRPLEVKLRSDSKDALVTWAPSWPTNNTMPTGAFSTAPFSNALATNSRIFIRVQSKDGDLWANYRIQVTSLNQAVLGVITVNTVIPDPDDPSTDIVQSSVASTSTGTPAGSWDSPALVNGSDLAIKGNVSGGDIRAVVEHSGGTTPGTLSWAAVDDLETEPEFVALSQIQYFSQNAYIYVRTVNGNYRNIYRFPVTPVPISNDAALTAVSINGKAAALGTPNAVWSAAVAGTPVQLTTAELAAANITVARSFAAATIEYAVAASGATGAPSFASAFPAALSNNASLYIKVTAEDMVTSLVYRFAISGVSSADAVAGSIKIGGISAILGTPNAAAASAVAGSATVFGGNSSGVALADIVVATEANATVAYAQTTGSTVPAAGAFSAAKPASWSNNQNLWVRVTAENTTTVLYYRILINVSQNAAGFGVPDAAWAAANPNAIFPGAQPNSIMNVTQMPSTAVWNSRGHMHEFPDPFHFANGNKVETVADWENRRLEIRNILQYYEHGIMPPIEDRGQIGVADYPDDVIITWVDSGTLPAISCAITIRYRQNSWTTSISTSLPTGYNENNKYNPATGTGGYPVYFGSSGSNWTGYGATGTFPMSGTWANEGNGSGNVPDLFGLVYTDPSAPSANSSYAWGMSVILTVMEGIDLNNNGVIDDGEQGFRGLLNPSQVGLTGYSRNGKAAEAVGAFAMSRGGKRVGHVAIGSAGSGGPALERFLSPAGIRGPTMESWYDPIPVGERGIMSFDDLKGKPWFQHKIENGEIMVGPEGVPVQATIGGSADANRYKTVRGWAPYFEDFGTTPAGGTGSTTPQVLFNSTGITVYSSVEYWTGIQSLSEGRDETAGWFSVRFKEFTDLHFGLDIDHVIGGEARMPNRTKHGILCTIPFDQHYTSVLIPPNGVLFQDGYWVPRNNPESQFANWVIIDEVFKFYGEQEGDPEKYIWRNGFEMIMGTHGGNTGNEAPNRNYHARAIFEGNANTAYAVANPNLYKMREPRFMVDDPASRFDYYRMRFGRPGHPTIAERVAARVEPILPDYRAAEVNRPIPAIGMAPRYPKYPQGYTPSGIGFKPMDWRGLTDTPEPLTPQVHPDNWERWF